jgi:hypothetical protein
MGLRALLRGKVVEGERFPARALYNRLAPGKGRIMGNVKIELERVRAEILIDILERRLEEIQQIEGVDGSVVSNEIEREKSAIIPILVALEVALKTPPHQ